MAIAKYHAHLYYNEETLEEAQKMAQELQRLYDIPVGTFHRRPVGPHPVWSCQLSLNSNNFGQVIEWLLANRDQVDVFVHLDTGDDLHDHTKPVMWIGKSHSLKLDMFRK